MGHSPGLALYLAFSERGLGYAERRLKERRDQGKEDAERFAERFGAPAPWLNAYAATTPAEFFAVACEAHFVNPARFAGEFPQLAACLHEFFNQKGLQPLHDGRRQLLIQSGNGS